MLCFWQKIWRYLSLEVQHIPLVPGACTTLHGPLTRKRRSCGLAPDLTQARLVLPPVLVLASPLPLRMGALYPCELSANLDGLCQQHGSPSIHCSSQEDGLGSTHNHRWLRSFWQVLCKSSGDGKWHGAGMTEDFDHGHILGVFCQLHRSERQVVLPRIRQSSS